MQYKPGDRIVTPSIGRDQIPVSYMIHRALEGGMGEVYLCTHARSGEPFALKTFKKQAASDEFKQAFFDELKKWIVLEKHPNIVRCFNVTQDQRGQGFMVLEWVAGDSRYGASLREWIRAGSLPLVKAFDFVIDMCRGMIHANEKLPGIVHLDLKPDNVLVSQDHTAKITDFGLARVFQQTDLAPNMEQAQDVNQSISLGGTPLYMAPEQWVSGDVDQRTDIYAIGCIFYELLTGKPPFQGTTVGELFQQHMTAPPPRLPDDFSPALADIVSTCLEKQRDDRHASIGDFLQALITCYEDEFNRTPRELHNPEAFSSDDYASRATIYETVLQQTDKALEDFQSALELDPNNARVYINRSGLLSRLGKTGEALKDINKALELESEWTPEAYYMRAFIVHNGLAPKQRAIDDYTKAIEMNVIAAGFAWLNRGRCYMIQQQYAEAVQDFSTVIADYPARTEAYTDRAEAYCALEQYEEALADVQKALALNPQADGTHFVAGKVHFAAGNLSEAKRYFEQAAAMGHKAAAVHLKSVSDLLAAQDDAQPVVSQAAIYVQQGNQHAKLNQYKEAIVKYTQAIEADPHYVDAYLRRGLVYEEPNVQRFKDAVKDYTHAIEIDPTCTTAYQNRGGLHLYGGMMGFTPDGAAVKNVAAARADFEKLVELAPDRRYAHEKLAEIYQQLKEWDKAAAQWTFVIDHADEPTAHDYISRAQVLFNVNPQEAVNDCDRAIQLNAKSRDAYFFKGGVLAELKQYEEALAALEKAKQLGRADADKFITMVKKRMKPPKWMFWKR